GPRARLFARRRGPPAAHGGARDGAGGRPGRPPRRRDPCGGGTVTLTLPPATPQDAKLIWGGANDPTVRACAFSREPIPWESHLRWYENQLASPGTRFWVVEEDGEPVGQIRYDRDEAGRAAEISFSVARDHRGRGFGVELIQRTCGLAL